MAINDFHGQNHFLSNFFECTVNYNGLVFSSAESAFQAQKSESPYIQTMMSVFSPLESRRYGRKVKLRRDWEDVKERIMSEIVYAKFIQHKDLADKLLATGDQELIEGNLWGDTYWGVDKRTGLGQNNLGKILMNVRNDIKQLRENERRNNMTTVNRKPAAKNPANIILKVEGSANTQNKNGAYISKLVLGEHEKEFIGSASETTNNRMALDGIISALEALNDRAKGATIEIHSSCTYIYDCATRGTIGTYLKNNWTTPSGVEAKNRDLWEKLLEVKKAKGIKVKFSLDENKDMKKKAREMVRTMSPVVAEI